MTMKNNFEIDRLENKITNRSLTDENFRKSLVENPHEVIEQQLGINIPKGLKINILENRDKTINIVLPSSPYALSPEIRGLFGSATANEVVSPPTPSVPGTKETIYPGINIQKPNEIPQSAKADQLLGGEQETYNTWTFGFWTNAWAWNVGNQDVQIMHKTAAPTSPEAYVYIPVGGTARFHINGHGFKWLITNTTFSNPGTNDSLVVIFVW